MPLRLLNKGQGEVSALSHQFLLLHRQIIYTQMYDSEEKGGGGRFPPRFSVQSFSIHVGVEVDL